jgi:hypothetical protein
MDMTLELPRKGLIKQELVSYEIDELTNMVVKKIHTRKYAEDGVDYIDTWNSEPLCEAKNEETNLNLAKYKALYNEDG